MAFGEGKTRRDFVKLAAAGAAGAAALAACGAPAAPTAAPAKPTEPPKPAAPAAPTTAPAAAKPTAPAAAAPTAAAKPTEAPKPAAPAAPAPTTAPAAAAPAAKPKDVPRNRTLVLMWSGVQGKYIDHQLWNPYAIGANHQNGPGLFYEPLYYFSAFANKYYPWLATGHTFSSDLTQLTIKLRSGISWSDGTPFTAEDVAFTYNTLRDLNTKVRWGPNIKEFVKEAKATDPQTVVVTFNRPTPRFIQFTSYKYDIGVYIVPKHIFSQNMDWDKFTHDDISKGQPITTGPWKLVYASQEQKIIDRRDDWWAVKAGLVSKMPAVERIVYLPIAGETQMAQAYITNQIDSALDLRPVTIKQVIASNPKIITWTGRDTPPYGYTDWWPTSLYLNCEKAPFNDPDVRWAISYFIDRDQVVAVGNAGAGSKSELPMPKYPPLLPYFDGIKDLLAKWPTNKFDPAKGAELLTKKGWKKGADGFWNDDKGQRVKLPINGTQIFADIGPVIAEQLKKQGIDAVYQMPPDAGDQFTTGTYTGQLNGHGGSIEDPYETLRLYMASMVGVPGSHAVNRSRWYNTKYDAIVNEMAVTPLEDKAKLMDQWRRAMEIWLPELPDVQITEWYHRIALNTTYWKNWPTKDNAYVNAAFWHLTFQLILNNLEPA